MRMGEMEGRDGRARGHMAHRNSSTREAHVHNMYTSDSLKSDVSRPDAGRRWTL